MQNGHIIARARRLAQYGLNFGTSALQEQLLVLSPTPLRLIHLPMELQPMIAIAISLHII